MYLLEVETSFEAAHRLPNYNGPCRRLHGHTYIVHAMWAVDKLDKQGMAIDLVVLKQLLHDAVVGYDHQSLNVVMAGNPTAENLARSIFQRLQKRTYGDNLVQVSVDETRGTRVTYRGD